MKRRGDRGSKRQREAIPAWRSRSDAPVTVIAPAGIDGVHFDADPEHVGVQGARAGRLANALLATIRKDCGRG